jgi:quinol-cytochrome oxidoreductase complex cytochrome b subunit
LKGRRLNWHIGIGMLLIILLLNFSGYLLPWDQLAYWAVTIGSNIAASARELTDALGITHLIDIGGLMKRLLIGAETVGQEALSRFYMLHIVFLPVSLFMLMGWHFWRMRKDGGLSKPEDVDELAKAKYPEPRIYSWPTLMWAELAALTFVCAVLMIFAFFIDAPLKELANPFLPENPAKSPWYFLGIQELVSYSAFAGGLVIPVLFIFFLASIPYKDREDRHIGKWFSNRTGKNITFYSLLFSAAVTVGALFVNVNYGWLGDWFKGVPQIVLIFVNPGTVLTLAYILWAWFIKRKSGSLHFSAMALFTCAMVGFIILTAVGILFRGPNWEFFWTKYQWPPI